TIGKDGVPTSLQVMNRQIDPDLARAAVEAVSQWLYQPTLLTGSRPPRQCWDTLRDDCNISPRA
ncbi:MAG: energy transducer TonB, partial [Acidobacteriota bacterium]|nr:energy transducer TonB [Acidobacteriota bacterium]